MLVLLLLLLLLLIDIACKVVAVISELTELLLVWGILLSYCSFWSDSCWPDSCWYGGFDDCLRATIVPPPIGTVVATDDTTDGAVVVWWWWWKGLLIRFVAPCDWGATADAENGDDEVKGLLLGIVEVVIVVAAKGLFIVEPNGLLLLLLLLFVVDKNGFVVVVVVGVDSVGAANGLFDMDDNGAANGLLLIVLNGLLLSLLLVAEFRVSFVVVAIVENGLYGAAAILNGLLGDNDCCCNDDGLIDTAEGELLSGDNFFALAVWRGELLFLSSSSSSSSPSLSPSSSSSSSGLQRKMNK